MTVYNVYISEEEYEALAKLAKKNFRSIARETTYIFYSVSDHLGYEEAKKLNRQTKGGKKFMATINENAGISNKLKKMSQAMKMTKSGIIRSCIRKYFNEHAIM